MKALKAGLGKWAFSAVLAACIGIGTAFGQLLEMPQLEEIHSYPTLQPEDSGEAVLYLDSAIRLYKNGDPAEALILFRRILHFPGTHSHPKMASDAFAYIVTIYNNQGLYEQAYREISAIKTYAATWNMPALFPLFYNGLANRYQRMGQPDSAMYYYYQAIASIEADSAYFNPAALPSIYVNLSGILNAMGDYENALGYLIKAETVARSVQHWHILALALINKGGVYNNLNKYKAGNASLREALTIARAHQLLQWEHLALSNLASLKHQEGDHTAALRYLKEALQLKGEIDPNYRNLNLQLMGEIFRTRSDYTNAEHYALEALRHAEQFGISRGVVRGNYLLSELYTTTGNYPKALEHFRQYAAITDSLRNAESQRSIHQLEVKYQTAQKDQQLSERALQVDRQRHMIRQKNSWIIGISAGAALLAAIAALLYTLFRNNRHQKRLQEEKVRNLEQQQEIGQLKATMKGEENERIRIARELHDGIGGMLASIKMNMNTLKAHSLTTQSLSDFNKVTGMLTDTAAEVRKTAHNLMPDILTRQSLREALLIYCENCSSGSLHVDLQYDVEMYIENSAALFIYRIVQELLQNVVKHAHATYAVVQLMLEGQWLSITVEDNGVGFKTDAPNTDVPSNKGSGLNSIRNRVEPLQGYMSVSSVEGSGTTVHIEFDFKQLKHL